MLSIAGASSATAAPSIKPKLTATATATAVRPTLGSLSIPEAKASWTGAGNFDNTSNLNTVRLTTAPSGAATMTIDDTASGNTTATLAVPATGVGVTAGTDDSSIRFNVDTAGAYAGSIANGTDTVSFSFTTAGAPTSMTLTPATQTLLVGAVATVTVTLKDAAGNTTQPQTVDSVTLVSSGDDTVSTSPLTGAKGGALQYGVVDDTIATQSAGTSTLTATPLGTLPGSGVTAATATLVKAGAVSVTPATSVKVTTPTNAISTPANTDDTVDRTVAVQTGTSTVVLTIDDTTGNAAGSQLRFKLTPIAGGTVTVGGQSGSSTSALFVDVTTSSTRTASITATLSGTALLAGSASLTVKQVDVLDANLTSGAGIVVNQTAAAVSDTTITVSPDDSVVAKLGDSIPVTVTVADQFGNLQSGWVVAASRGTSVPGTFLNQATTNASGEATVTVTSLAGSTAPKLEQYSFNATPTIGSAVPVNNALQVTYTATGEIASLSVAGLGGTVVSPTSVTNTTTAVVTAPLVTVPFGGTASTISAQSFTVATGANVAGGAAGQVAAFQATPSTLTPITASVPIGSTGVFVSTTPSTLWSAGKSTVTVGADDTVYVFGTQAGLHNVTFTAGGRSVTIPVKVQTSMDAAYNVAITPKAQELAVGAIGTATVKVTDVFGNAVASATGGSGDDTGQVTVTASGAVLLAGFNTQQNFVTNASGEATVTIIAGNAPGAATLTVTPKVGTATPAWQTAYTPPTGAPAPVLSDAALIAVGAGPDTKSITIVGERTTVSGRSGIIVDGIVTGIEDGKTVVPYIRFPGQTTFTAGSARPEITDGEFVWQRKTGKRVTVYVTNDDGDVRSNRVTIQTS